MQDIIADAIENRWVIQFIYEGQLRIVEPFVLGLHKDTGNLVLRSYRVGGYSKSKKSPPWRLFKIAPVSYTHLTLPTKA